MRLSKEQAERNLKAAVQRASRSRVTRRVTAPWKELYPKLLRAVGLSHRASSKTFWNGRFDVVLPEGTSTHIWRYGFFESDVCTFMLRGLEPGMVFVDVGAHFGFFTLLGSDLVTGEGLVVSAMDSAFGQRNTGGERGKVGTVQVTARTCDEVVATLGLRRVDLVKIDAESSELHVLFGAERLIQ